MSDHNTILERMRSRLALPASTAEGSFVGDVLGAVANELARIYSMELEPMLDNAFISTAGGEALTRLCENYGIVRQRAAKATAFIDFTGPVGTVISGVRLLADGLVYEVEEGQIYTETGCRLTATAAETGSAYNAEAGAIDTFENPVEGLAIAGASAATGGVDEETDDDLRERTLLRIRTPSAGGNEADYLTWALSVPGVMRAAIRTVPPTVNVYLVADGNRLPDNALMTQVGSVIREKRPVGASIVVLMAQQVTLDAEIAVDCGEAEIGEVTEAIRRRIGEYFEELALTGRSVSYMRIAEMLFVDGVEDVSSYTLNGGTVSIPLTDIEFPVLGTLTVTRAGGEAGA